jgi:hypothetical protein
MTSRLYRTLSIGLGVQSSTLAAMSAHGEVDRLDSVIFADTHGETDETYAWGQFMEDLITSAGIRFVRTAAGDLLHDHLTAVNRVSQAPLFVLHEGKMGRIMRRCSRDYKVVPVRQAARKLMLEAGTKRIEQWVGISWDEIERMKEGGPAYITTRWPLIEMRMTRDDCLQWMTDHGYPRPPRSACYFCPQASNTRWVAMRDHHPTEFKKAVAADYAIREHGVPGIAGTVFLHRSGVPLEFAPIDKDDSQQVLFDDPDCEGGCFL